MAPEIQDIDPAPSAAPTQGIGSLLREARERLGQSLPLAASSLRIRQPYLQAIENGRFQDLPGSAYAVGFVRSYAEYLGLDGAEIVRRFKQESGVDFSGRAELSFPSATSEGSFPTGGMLFLALALAVVGYGIWYWISREPSVAESVPALPDRLAALIHKPVGNGSEVVAVGGAPATPALAPVAAAPVETPAPAPAAAPREDVVPPNEGDGADKPAAAAPAPAPVPAQMAAPIAPPASVAAPVVPALPAKTKPVAAESVSAAPAAVAPLSDEAAKTQALNQAQSPAAVPDQPKPTSGRVDQPVALPADAARVILKANEDCWIRIRDASGTIIHSGVLRKGTSFRVTQRPGQTLTAGNAGALVVLVDNRPLPPLGGAGIVRKDLPLDPDKLSSAPVPTVPAPDAPAAEPAPKGPTE